MPLIVWPATALALVASATNAQQAPVARDEGSLRIVLPVIQPPCGKPDPAADVVVCGQHDQRYRIDPTVLATTRARAALDHPPRPEGQAGLFRETCSPVGGHGCAGQGTIPVSSIAIVLASALIKAVKGEDLRPMLRPGPSDYDLYKQEKASDEAKQGRPVAAPK